MDTRPDLLRSVTRASELQATLSLVDTLIDTERKARRIPGISAAIIYDQAVLWSKGFGLADIARHLPATPHTIYLMASVTKLFTATALMHLRDAGKLQLDDPLEQYLSGITVKSHAADAAPLTFRQVAAHMAGLPRDESLDRIHHEDFVIHPSVDRFLAGVREIELVAAPLTTHLYSNLGYMLLGLALGQAAGQPYIDYVRQHLLAPLGMQSSGFEPTEMWPSSVQTHLAIPYKPQRTDETVPPTAPRTVAGAMIPALGLYSTIEDIARFISLQFRDGPAHGSQILKGSTLREMHSPLFLDAGWQSAAALGWAVERVQNQTVIGHSGGAYGSSTDILLVPALKLGLALFMNTTEDASGLNRMVLERLLPTVSRVLALLPEPVSASGMSTPPVQSAWKAYEGEYVERGLRLPLTVRLNPNRLIATLLETDVFLLPHADDQFRMQDSPLGDSIRFVRNGDGIVIQAEVNGGLLLFVRK
jgi:CubicO group peptidase (beta-lactamase class C family)